MYGMGYNLGPCIHGYFGFLSFTPCLLSYWARPTAVGPLLS